MVSKYFIKFRYRFLKASKHLQTTYPFKREDPAATSYAQQNIESSLVTHRHHMSRGLTNPVNDKEPTKCVHHLNHCILLPVRGEQSAKQARIIKQKIVTNTTKLLLLLLKGTYSVGMLVITNVRIA